MTFQKLFYVICILFVSILSYIIDYLHASGTCMYLWRHAQCELAELRINWRYLVALVALRIRAAWDFALHEQKQKAATAQCHFNCCGRGVWGAAIKQGAVISATRRKNNCSNRHAAASDNTVSAISQPLSATVAVAVAVFGRSLLQRAAVLERAAWSPQRQCMASDRTVAH